MKGKDLAELIGVTTVVLSLVFVGYEIRQNTAALEAQALLELNTAMNDVMLEASESQERAQVMLAGRPSPGDLSEADYYRFESTIWAMLNVTEAAFAFREHDLVDGETFSGWIGATCTLLADPGAAKVWMDHEEAFNTRFQALVRESCSTTSSSTTDSD